MLEEQRYSERVKHRMEHPMFLRSEKDREDFLANFHDNCFAYVFELKNSNGVIYFFGEIEPTRPQRIQTLFYETNVRGTSLAFLDALVELLPRREWTSMQKTLSLREVESFLRDQNNAPAFAPDDYTPFRIFEFVAGFESYMKERFITGHDRKSPSFKISGDSVPLYSVDERGAFNSLSQEERMAVIDEIFDQYVRQYLQKDGGDIEVGYVGDGMSSVVYYGSCNECSSALTSTLEYIQKTVRYHLQDPNYLVVTDS